LRSGPGRDDTFDQFVTAGDVLGFNPTEFARRLMLGAISMAPANIVILEQSARTEMTTKVMLEVITRWLRQQPIDEPTIEGNARSN
jgi:hypothetical protein